MKLNYDEALHSNSVFNFNLRRYDKEQAEKPTQSEIILNVPMALKLMFAAGAW